MELVMLDLRPGLELINYWEGKLSYLIIRKPCFQTGFLDKFLKRIISQLAYIFLLLQRIVFESHQQSKLLCKF